MQKRYVKLPFNPSVTLIQTYHFENTEEICQITIQSFSNFNTNLSLFTFCIYCKCKIFKNMVI